MRSLLGPLLAAVVAAPAFADGVPSDPRVDLRHATTGTAIAHPPATTLSAAPPAVRIFARRPRPDFAPLAAVPLPAPRPGPVVETVDDGEFWRAAGAG